MRQPCHNKYMQHSAHLLMKVHYTFVFGNLILRQCAMFVAGRPLHGRLISIAHSDVDHDGQLLQKSIDDHWIEVTAAFFPNELHGIFY